jgi:effector-binding domain-containing protein
MAEVIVLVQTVAPRTLAAVRRQVTIGEVSAAWRPALDRVWEFLRTQPGLRADGHNVFLYHRPGVRSAPMDVDFGVEVTRHFDGVGEVYATETPAGNVATAIHVGGYHRLKETHDAIQAWCAAHGRRVGGKSWEIYGDWTDDESKLETTIAYLLA